MIVFRNLVIFLTTPIAEAGWQITCYEMSLFKSSVGRKLKKYQYLSKSRKLRTYSEGYYYYFIFHLQKSTILTIIRHGDVVFHTNSVLKLASTFTLVPVLC